MNKVQNHYADAMPLLAALLVLATTGDPDESKAFWQRLQA